MVKKAILIFGTGLLQQSLIERCKMKGLFTVGIDPNPKAECKDDVDAFEIVAGDDFETTIYVALKYKISGVITAATDKPLVMMARVAEKLNLPYFSIETARIATDKHMMKQKFIKSGLACANGYLIDINENLADLNISYPVIVKPRDNSGSRGVIYCKNQKSIRKAIIEAYKYTNKSDILIEEYIEGKEYSIEGLHYKGEHHVIQITEKTTTNFPYNVELGHVQPADLSEAQKKQVTELFQRVAEALRFDNCASHSEIRINSKGVFVIEASPRLGGDYISSTLVPLSTGINMEDVLIDMSMGAALELEYYKPRFHKYSGILYFELNEGIIKSLEVLEELNKLDGIHEWRFDLEIGNKVDKITNSLGRYGYVIFQLSDESKFYKTIKKIKEINTEIKI